MKRTLIALSGMITILVIAYLAYDLTKGVISPCETIFEQSSIQIGAKLKLVESQGEVLIGREKIQDLTEAAQVTALNLKTCCIVLDAGNVDAKQFLNCKESAKEYETKVDTVIAQLEEAEVARKAGNRKVLEDRISKINETLEDAKSVSAEFQRDVEAISDVPKVKGLESQTGEIIFQWDGAEKTYWRVSQKDANGDYQNVADTTWLKRGQQAAVELAPGEYRVKMNWEHGFKSRDVAVKAGDSVSIQPVFGVVNFQWDGAEKTYWKVFQKDAYGDYQNVADTSWLKKGQQAAVELAPGEYRVKMNWEHGFKSRDVAVKAGDSVSIQPVFGVVNFQWDGAEKTYWKVSQKDAYGDYQNVADTSWLKKGQQAAVELAPGEYRVKMNWEHGFKSRDVAVKAGDSVSIQPVFGVVNFQWDGAEKTYWKVSQKDAYGDYQNVADTSWLKKGQQAAVELAPGEYRVKMNWEHGFKSRDVAVKAGDSVSIQPVFGVVNFQWDGAEKTYWKVFQKDAYGDYQNVADTTWLEKGQQAAVELAPGEYLVQREVEEAFKTKVVLETDEVTYVVQ